MRRVALALTLAASTAIVVTLSTDHGPDADVAATAAYSAPLLTAISDLPTEPEGRTGYSRDLFRHWIDADADGCDTRSEVLIAEADDPVTMGPDCTPSSGRWFSYYDRLSWTDQGRLDIDHMVPLAEAWDSGASQWTPSQRESYANDLGDPRALVGVTNSVNRSKGDQDPGTWMPEYDGCRYEREWVAVKVRWRLTVDPVELAALQQIAAACPNETITVTRAL